jgi:hypothetical protein
MITNIQQLNNIQNLRVRFCSHLCIVFEYLSLPTRVCTVIHKLFLEVVCNEIRQWRSVKAHVLAVKAFQTNHEGLAAA